MRSRGFFPARPLQSGGLFVKATPFMPTYEYECAKCGKTFEVFQSMKDDPLKTCPNTKCKGKVKRLIGTGAGLIFKGSGFYITDYRSEGYKQAAKKDSSSASSPGAGESKKSPDAPKSPDKPKSSGSAKPGSTTKP